MKRHLWRAAVLLLACPFAAAAAEKDDRAAAREALKELNDFVGAWNGQGGPPRGGRAVAKDVWSEKLEWVWKFKGDDAWLQVRVSGGKHFKGGDLKYLPEKKKYELTLEDLKGKKLVYLGELKDEVLTLERTDPDTKETQRLALNTAAEGVRFVYRSARKRAGSTLFNNEYEVAAGKAGEALGAKEKKNVCVVTGGLGTMAVGYKGQTFYVCCSGCRDAFNENPEKFIKEFEEMKKKKK